MARTTTAQTNGNSEPRPYEMTISRLTVDKLGVKLYDTVSAVVAELVANSYDADAEKVRVLVPLGAMLAKREKKSGKTKIKDLGETVTVIDDGHGMTRDEAIDHFLRVGRDRRDHPKGAKSRKKLRPVMGRKGIGKLAPFGICHLIEVRSAGGSKTAQGFPVSHFVMDYERILQDTDEPVEFEAGADDGKWSPTTGTTITLRAFLPKRVPEVEVFSRQLARRFALSRPDFRITIEDTKTDQRREVKTMDIPLWDGTKVDLAQHPVPVEDVGEKPVKGWLALARDAYKNEEEAGVRVYARGKLVAVTRDFEQPAGFTGEFMARSYLVGEVHAEWLDEDKGDDLIRTDRQNILWESEFGSALRTWGAALIKDIAAKARKPRREKLSARFIEIAKIEKRARDRFADSEVVRSAIELGKQIGGFADEDELADKDYVDDLADIVLAVAPHRALIEAFQEFSKQFADSAPTMTSLLDLFGKTRVAEMASYSQIAAERVRVIQELETLVLKDADEADLQRLIAEAPWLIEPTWSVVSKNQALKTFKKLFARFWKEWTGEDVSLAIGVEHESKRPDFTLVALAHRLHFVEIKAPGHAFNDTDCDRLMPYADALDKFFEDHDQISAEFPLGWRIDLITDDVKLTTPANKRAMKQLTESEKLHRSKWGDFLLKAKNANEAFLKVADAKKP